MAFMAYKYGSKVSYEKSIGGISSSNRFSGEIFSWIERFPFISITIWSLRKYVANAIAIKTKKKFLSNIKISGVSQRVVAKKFTQKFASELLIY